MHPLLLLWNVWLGSNGVRHFVECANQDAKILKSVGMNCRLRNSALGTSSGQMTIMATCSLLKPSMTGPTPTLAITQLAQELEVKALPALSVANVRALLQASMPLPQLSPEFKQPNWLSNISSIVLALLEVAISRKVKNVIQLI